MSDGQSQHKVSISRQPVELYKILKFEGLVDSGANAKRVIDDGLVRVNSEVETRRRRKINHGDQIEYSDTLLIIEFAGTDSL